MTLSNRGREFWKGASDTLPLVIGAVRFGIIFGTLSAGAGLSAWRPKRRSNAMTGKRRPPTDPLAIGKRSRNALVTLIGGMAFFSLWKWVL